MRFLFAFAALASLASGPFSPVRGRGDVRQLTPIWANMVFNMT